MDIRKKIFEQCAAFLRFFYLRKKSKFNAFVYMSYHFDDPTVGSFDSETTKMLFEYEHLDKNYFITTLEAGVAYINICTRLYFFFFPEDIGKYPYLVYIDNVKDKKIKEYLKEKEIQYFD